MSETLKFNSNQPTIRDSNGRCWTLTGTARGSKDSLNGDSGFICCDACDSPCGDDFWVFPQDEIEFPSSELTTSDSDSLESISSSSGEETFSYSDSYSSSSSSSSSLSSSSSSHSSSSSSHSSSSLSSSSSSYSSNSSFSSSSYSAGEPTYYQEVTPCPDGSGGYYPSMNVQIDASDSELPITWCGITWQPSSVSPLSENERHSGESAEICPQTYFFGIEDPEGFTPKRDRRHKWVGPLANLVMTREMNFEGSYWAWWNKLWIAHGTFFKADEYYWYAGSSGNCSLVTPTSFSQTVTNALNMIIGEPHATCSSYKLTDAWFGSRSFNNVQYTWWKDAGWEE
jgi:hypothetical protein